MGCPNILDVEIYSAQGVGGGMRVMYQVKGDSQRPRKKVTEGAMVQLRQTFVVVAFGRELLKWWNGPWRIWGGEAGVVSGRVIAAMIAVTTVRSDNKSNYKDGHRGTDPAAVCN